MSIQSVGNRSSLWQHSQTMRKDLKTSSQDISTFQTTQKSGTQDQIETSQNVLQQPMTSLLNDITNVQSVMSGTSAGAQFGLSEGEAKENKEHNNPNASSNLPATANPDSTLYDPYANWNLNMSGGQYTTPQGFGSILHQTGGMVNKSWDPALAFMQSIQPGTTGWGGKYGSLIDKAMEVLNQPGNPNDIVISPYTGQPVTRVALMRQTAPRIVNSLSNWNDVLRTSTENAKTGPANIPWWEMIR